MPNTVVTRGMGAAQQLVTRGCGGTLVIVIDQNQPVEFGFGPGPVIGAMIPVTKRDFRKIPRLIKTRKIVVPDEDDEITVDVVLLNREDFQAFVEAVLASKKYTDIRVYVRDEVEFHD